MYTEIEKNLFLKILEEYAAIIEKKSDARTLADKEKSWHQISEKFNASTVILTR